MSNCERSIWGNGNARRRNRLLWNGLVALALLGVVATSATRVQAAIPQSERDVLTALYTSTAGASWNNSSGWNGAAGTECTWYRVTCDGAQSHVTRIVLDSNNLTGTLPSLAALPSLERFDGYNNHLVGSIPSLSGMTSLQDFSVFANQMTGTIPTLSSLANLKYFYVGYNQLSGSIPSLAGLTNLIIVNVQHNQLTGTIPSLAGLSNLAIFEVNINQLTGPIPSFADLANLQLVRMASNALGGIMPTPPNPANLLSGQSTLCPNALDRTPNTVWDSATGATPWYEHCGPPSGVSTATGSMHYARRLQTATRLLNGRVLIAGGQNDALTPAMINVPIAEIYDPATGLFSEVGTLNQGKGRRNATANLLADGKVLISGGYDDVSGNLTSSEIFDPATSQFAFTGDMAGARSLHASATLANGRVLVIGGYPSSTTAETFNPATGQFTATGMLNQSRVYDRAITLSGGKVLVTGAEDGGLSNELYDPVAGTFAYTASFVQPTSTGGLALLEDGRVLAAGGYYQGGYEATAQTFNPATGQFALTGSMAEGRSGYQLTALNNGQVLASGSFYGSATMELYDPQMGQFIPAVNMTTARGDHTATLLTNGRVLIVGGTPNDGSSVLATAEIYAPDVVRRAGFD
ncbi:MAG: hypothetical protein ABI451_07845 [Dokdonella sp.]